MLATVSGFASSVLIAAMVAQAGGTAAAPPPAPPETAPPACEPNPKFDEPSPPQSRRARISPSEYVGKRAAQLIAKYGEPVCKSAAKWRYHQPRGCTDWRTVITLWFKSGKVIRVNMVAYYTGEHCVLVD